MIIMEAQRREVKQWLKTMDREEFEKVIHDSMFTTDELKYIRMRCIDGKSFKEIAIECGLSRRAMCNITKRIAYKMHKSITKNGFN